MRDIAILLNPSAGRGRAGKKQGHLENMLKRYGIIQALHYKLFVSQSEDHLRNLAIQTPRDYPIIIGAGGDGTFNIIVNELMKLGSENIFGMISLGSQNDIAKEFGVESLEKACLAIKNSKNSRARQVDIGVVIADNLYPYYFLGTASLVLGTTVNKYMENISKRHPVLFKFGLIQAIFGILGIHNSFSTKEVPIQLKLKYQNRSFQDNFSLVVFNNISFYAGGKRLDLDATPYDGQLNCCYITSKSFSRFVKVYSLYRKGKHIYEKDVKLLKAPEFKITSENGVEIQTDGIVSGPYKDITISVKPKALRVIVHPSYVGSR